MSTPECGACAPPVAIALGANLGERRRTLEWAIAELGRLPATRLLRVSSLYETPPWGVAGQPDYFNAVVTVHTLLAPETLLQALFALEREAGRVRRERWGARTLDLDLVLYGTLRQQRAALELPHPRAHLRAFVLLPLIEICPNVEIPGHGPAQDLVADVDQAGIRVVGPLQ